MGVNARHFYQHWRQGQTDIRFYRSFGSRGACDEYIIDPRPRKRNGELKGGDSWKHFLKAGVTRVRWKEDGGKTEQRTTLQEALEQACVWHTTRKVAQPLPLPAPPATNQNPHPPAALEELHTAAGTTQAGEEEGGPVDPRPHKRVKVEGATNGARDSGLLGVQTDDAHDTADPTPDERQEDEELGEQKLTRIRSALQQMQEEAYKVVKRPEDVKRLVDQWRGFRDAVQETIEGISAVAQVQVTEDQLFRQAEKQRSVRAAGRAPSPPIEMLD